MLRGTTPSIVVESCPEVKNGEWVRPPVEEHAEHASHAEHTSHAEHASRIEPPLLSTEAIVDLSSPLESQLTNATISDPCTPSIAAVIVATSVATIVSAPMPTQGKRKKRNLQH